MKKKIILVAMLFVQVFLTSETVQAAGVETIESGKGNLSPADNESN